MQQIDEFKEGDTVWCAAYGQGEVAEIDPKLERPVIVYFYDGRNAIEAHYTLDGRLGINGQRVLYFAQPKVAGKTTRPFVSKTLNSYVMCVTISGGQFFGLVTEDSESSFTILYNGEYQKLEKSVMKSLKKVTIEPTNYA